MLTNYARNCLGTLDFMAQFPGMRKPQEFSTYPLKSHADAPDRVMVQSETRIGWVYLTDGRIEMSKPHSSGAYFQHLSEAQGNVVHTLTGEALLTFKAHIAATSSRRAGSSFVTVDNGGAIQALNVGGAA